MYSPLLRILHPRRGVMIYTRAGEKPARAGVLSGEPGETSAGRENPAGARETDFYKHGRRMEL